MMEDFYREYILDHYRNPRNRGVIESPDITYVDSNPLCGDEIQIDLLVKNGVVTTSSSPGVAALSHRPPSRCSRR